MLVLPLVPCRGRCSAGISLIETMIALSVAAIVLSLGVPAFADWVRRAEVRSAAEGLSAALQQARAEAVQRNATVTLTLTSSAGLPSWSIGCLRVNARCPAIIRQQAAAANTQARVGAATANDGALAAVVPLDKALIAGAHLPASVSFNAMGALAQQAVASDITRLDFTHAGRTAARRMVILIGSGGMIRLCDPALPSAGAGGVEGCQ